MAMQKAEQPRHRRLGPRPLPLHLNLAMASWMNSSIVLPLLSNVLNNWQSLNPNAAPSTNLAARENLAELARQISQADPTALAAALQTEGHRRFRQLLSGIESYRKHPYKRDLPLEPVIWSEGTTKLRHYRSSPFKSYTKRPHVLVVPSLVNRYYVLDLDSHISFLRWLDAKGFNVFVIDWDAPGNDERCFDLTNYICKRLEPALDVVKKQADGPVHLLGYCMGGNLALALALRRQADIATLVLLATPWNFHAENDKHAQMAKGIASKLEPVLNVLNELPVDILQAFFSALDPFQVLKKFQHFAALDQSSTKAQHFVALEDWLNDGVSLAAPVARECLKGWYGDNTPYTLAWKVAGQVVDPAYLQKPTLNIIPKADRIVPQSSARALMSRLQYADEISPEVGHIGMMVGQKSITQVWTPIADWLTQSRE